MKFDFSVPDILEIKEKYVKSETVFRRGQSLIDNEMCTLVSESDNRFNFIVEDRFDDFHVTILPSEKKSSSQSELSIQCNCDSHFDCCPHSAAALIMLRIKFDEAKNKASSISSKYTKKEMIKRVLKERQEKAAKEKFEIRLAENIHGFHKIKTEEGRTYEITIRDFAAGSGYCSCPDFKTNKLGTCKHLIFASDYLNKKFKNSKSLTNQDYPFVEIYCDPHYDYNITYFYERNLQPEVDTLIHKYFPRQSRDGFPNGSQYIMPERYSEFLKFIEEAEEYKSILIRPEVNEKIDKYFDTQSLKQLSEKITPDFSKIKAKLFDYQKESILFSLFKKGNIIADEMGLGKTLQAIAVAILKKDIYGLNKALIICPASLKYQWKKEIERFTGDKALIIEGVRSDRHSIYKSAGEFFLIANYEAVMRDITIIHQYPPDMIILDEAQKIKNYDTKTSHAVKSIPKKHSLVITGTPLENNLLDLYSIMNFVDPEVLAPQWEFSMNHCYFDKDKRNMVTGYFNLQELKNKLADYVIRREKADVLKELPAVQEVTVPVVLHEAQAEIHAGFARSLAPILHKKHKTFYDMQRIQQILTSMRMVCDSTFLIDKETNYSPKLDELEIILLEKLSIKNRKRKVIIFSEWKTMLHLIGKMLKTNGIQYVTLSGDVPVNKRSFLIDEFANNPDTLVFLSTEAGGTGLNLQFADTVINFDLPWNPAKKNQRIGRINRIGQVSPKLTAINMVAQNSIEHNIANGIVVKEALFNAVLNNANLTEEVDFAAKGRSTFIEQVNKMIQPVEAPEIVHDESFEETKVEIVNEAESAGELIEETVLLDEKIKSGNAGTTISKIISTKDDLTEQHTPEPQEIETTLNQGMQFLNGIFKMATGKELITEGKGITVNRETGEVTMKFKLPGF
ncbi:MAG: DEAD/DEAH box helicase [Bacteroidetes bacterium]|nr:DEAD/DEAH box helicase [Bacteroidota bacterium]